MRLRVSELYEAGVTRDLSARWFAGLLWSIYAILGVVALGALAVTVIGIVLIPVFAPVFVIGPIYFATGIWVGRSVLVALGATLFCAVLCLVCVGVGASMAGLTWGVPGVASGIAAMEMRSQNKAAAALRRRARIVPTNTP
jgi:hypothetical protein